MSGARTVWKLGLINKVTLLYFSWYKVFLILLCEAYHVLYSILIVCVKWYLRTYHMIMWNTFWPCGMLFQNTEKVQFKIFKGQKWLKRCHKSTILHLLGTQLHGIRPSVSCDTAGHPTCGIVPHTTISCSLIMMYYMWHFHVEQGTKCAATVFFVIYKKFPMITYNFQNNDALFNPIYIF